MDDIVKRIRQQSYFGLEPYEAADEIEQLRQRVQELEKEQVAWRKFIERANNTVSAAEAERDELLKACDALLEWDFVRGFRLPYKVRDPIIAAIKEMK